MKVKLREQQFLQSKSQAKQSISVLKVCEFGMTESTLAHLLDRELQRGEWKHYAVYEDKLQRLWPPSEKDRERKIAQFATKYGFRVRFYSKGLCVIFDKEPAIRHQVHRSYPS